jgi:hypothetical protein
MNENCTILNVERCKALKTLHVWLDSQRLSAERCKSAENMTPVQPWHMQTPRMQHVAQRAPLHRNRC